MMNIASVHYNLNKFLVFWWLDKLNAYQNQIKFGIGCVNLTGILTFKTEKQAHTCLTQQIVMELSGLDNLWNRQNGSFCLASRR